MLLRYRLSLGFFIFGLIASGLTTFPLRWELRLLDELSAAIAGNTLHTTGFSHWIAVVHTAIDNIHERFPFFFYATDWLGFGHLVISSFFILPLVNPVKYTAVLRVGLAACVGVIVVALVCGSIRGIPLGWQLIDCSFGIIGAIPLLYCLRLARIGSGAL